MSSFCFISPIGYSTPMLFDTFEKTFKEKGHEIVGDVNAADIVLFDMHTRIGDYDNDIISTISKKPTVFFDAWDYGTMHKDGFPYINHAQIKSLMSELKANNSPIIYFVRKLEKRFSNDGYYPYELIQYPDHDFPLVSKEELFNRKIDLCFIGNTTPTRDNFIAGLVKHNCFNIDYRFNSYERVEHDEWLNRHRKAKFFITACGAGFSDERQYQLITIAPMLRNKSNHFRLNDFVDMVDCVEMDENPSESDREKLLKILNDKDRLYDMYMAGIKRMKLYFNAEYRANYILETILKHILHDKRISMGLNK